MKKFLVLTVGLVASVSSFTCHSSCRAPLRLLERVRQARAFHASQQDAVYRPTLFRKVIVGATALGVTAGVGISGAQLYSELHTKNENEYQAFVKALEEWDVVRLEGLPESVRHSFAKRFFQEHNKTNFEQALQVFGMMSVSDQHEYAAQIIKKQLLDTAASTQDHTVSMINILSTKLDSFEVSKLCLELLTHHIESEGVVKHASFLWHFLLPGARQQFLNAVTNATVFDKELAQKLLLAGKDNRVFVNEVFDAVSNEHWKEEFKTKNPDLFRNFGN